MAGEDNEGARETSERTAKPDEPKTSAPEADASNTNGPTEAGVPQSDLSRTDAPTPVTGRPGTAAEWTASDTRGPLNTAVEKASADGADHLEWEQVTPFVDEPVNGTGSTPHASAARASTPGADSAAEAARADETRLDNSGTVPPRRRSLWPVAAGIVLGAAIGAGSAYYVDHVMPAEPGNDQKLADLGARVDALDKRPDAAQAVAPMKASIADLTAKVQAAEADARKALAQARQPAAAPADAGTAPDVSALQQKLDALDKQVAELRQQETPAGDVKALQGKLDAMDQTLAGVAKKADSTASDVQAIASGQKALEGKVTSAPALAVVADSLIARIRRGQPFAAQVKALDSLGVDPAKVAPLRAFADQGVASAATLAAKFDPMTDSLLAATRPIPSGASFWDRMKVGASSLVSIHRVGDVSGDDIASRVERIKRDLAQDDVPDAVATWDALPAADKTKPEAIAWATLAKAHADALRAAQAIEHDAIASLGAKKS